MSDIASPERALAPFVSEGLVSRPVARLASGKEATVWCCEAGAALPDHELVAVKLYRPPERRAFNRHIQYFEGRYLAGRCTRKAVETRNRIGRQILFAEWIAHEHRTLELLSSEGVRVPRGIACSSNAVVMEYVGDRDGAAPLLHRTRLPRDEVRLVAEELLEFVERMLSCDLIHGDLSAYNVLHWEGLPWIIDVPQAADPRTHPRASEFLARDIERIAEWAGAGGVQIDWIRVYRDLWSRWLGGEL